MTPLGHREKIAPMLYLEPEGYRHSYGFWFSDDINDWIRVEKQDWAEEYQRRKNNKKKRL